MISVELDERIFQISQCQEIEAAKYQPPILLKDTATTSEKSQLSIKIDDFGPKFKQTDTDVPSASSTVRPSDGYVNSANKEAELDDEQVEYDMDREDQVWLKIANSRRKQLKNTLVDEIVFERAINMLEKESHFQLSKSGEHIRPHIPLIDNDAKCCICNDGDDSNANQIIFCDMCNIAVHQECYGVPYIPEGQWLCRRCQLSPSTPVHCALCPLTSGAFKQTSDGKWVHVICTLWLNEVHFANTVFLEPVEGVEFSLKRRAKLTCMVCKRKKIGACLQCSNRACTRAFHVTCALHSGMRMVIREERNKTLDNVTTINRYVFCHQHSSSTSQISNVAAWKRANEEKIKSARKMLHNSVKDLPQVSVPVIPQETVNEIAKELKLDNMEDIYYYWSLKRSSRCGVPLIRRLQVYHTQKQLNRRSDEFVTTPLDDEVPQEHRRLAYKRRDLERARLLCELVKKREKLKREFFLASESIVLNAVKPLSIIMRDTLNKLIEKDHQRVFTQAVNEVDVPGYRSVIPHPMDFQKMDQKLKSGHYKHLSDLKTDFKLMMSNCTKFNKDNVYFWKYGHRIDRIGLRVFKAAEAEEAKISSLSWAQEHAARLDLVNVADLMKIQEELKWWQTLETAGTSTDQLQTQKDQKADKSGQKTVIKRKFGDILKPTDIVETTTEDRPIKKIKTSTSRRSTPSNKGASRKGKPQSVKDTEFLSPMTPLNSNSKASVPTITQQKQSEIDPQKADTIQNSNSILKPLKALSKDFTAPRVYRQTPLNMRPRKVKPSFDYCTTATEGSSASDTGGVTSMDELLDTVLKKKSAGNVKKAAPATHTRLARATRLTVNEFDSNDLETFVHNDLVWAPLDSELLMPARVIDLRMRVHLDDDGIPVEKAFANKPKDVGHTLVVFFDLINTWRWVPTNRLRQCIPTSTESSYGETIAAALQKAKLFWKTVMSNNTQSVQS